MRRRVVSGIMLTLLLIGMLTLAFNIQPVRASGTLYIGSDYTFSSNIYEPIVVTADNIIINGNGYTLQGTGSGTGIYLSCRSNVTITNMKIEAFWEGIRLYESSNNSVSGNNITNNGIVGIGLFGSSNYNSISGNNITASTWYGIYLTGSSNNSISRNNMANNSAGIILWSSNNYNTISENYMTTNEYGIYLDESSNNKIYHNNFIDNRNHVFNVESNNTWDDGYPSGGNYWSDYIVKGGYDADGDGIGDIRYRIDINNRDRYPLMEPWSIPAMIRLLIRTMWLMDFPKGTENSLTSKLEGAIHLLDIGNENGAIQKLMGFINQVAALRGKKLTIDHADYLISEAQRITDLIQE